MKRLQPVNQSKALVQGGAGTRAFELSMGIALCSLAGPVVSS